MIFLIRLLGLQSHYLNRICDIHGRNTFNDDFKARMTGAQFVVFFAGIQELQILQKKIYIE